MNSIVRLPVCFVLALSFAFAPQMSDAEWYAGGYGGYSAPNKLSSVQMPTLGDQQAQALFPQYSPANGDTLTSSLSSSDISLKSSAMFGGKAGYFFTNEGFSWLGVEIEAFTSKPTIKQQTVNTLLQATYSPKNPAQGVNEPTTIIQPGTLQLTESSMRLITVAFNVVARYPGKVLQPYIGVGVGGFYFSSSGQISGRQVVPGLNLSTGLKVLLTEEWGLFIEGKYNLATITNLDPTGFGLSGQYSALNAIGGIAYHF